MDCSPPGSSVHGILQARRILEWVAVPSRRDLLSLDPAKHSLAICLSSPLQQEAGLRQKWGLDKLTDHRGVQGDGQQRGSGHSILGVGGGRQLCQQELPLWGELETPGCRGI